MPTVKEMAVELEVSERRVRQRIAEGSLMAEKVGRDWVVGARGGVLRRQAGRPLAPASAWDVVAVRAGAGAHLPAGRRERARRRLDALLRREAGQIAVTLAPRARRIALVAAAVDLSDLLLDPRFVPAGLSSPASQMVQPGLAEGYVQADHVTALATDFLLRPAREPAEANVVLHAVPEQRALDLATDPMVTMCDLVEHGTSRDLQVARAIRAEL